MKIQPQELRIGNLVEDRGGKILRIDYWESANKIAQKMFIEGKKVHPMTEYVGYLRPIPITEDILMKAGFEKVYKDNTWDVLKISFIDGEYTYWIPGLYYLTLNGSRWCFYNATDEDVYWEIHSNVEYLHQLQNLVHSLSGEELTINLNDKPTP